MKTQLLNVSDETFIGCVFAAYFNEVIIKTLNRVSLACRKAFAPVAAGAVALGAAGANAASFIPADVTTGLGDLKADVTTIGGLVILIGLAFAAYRIIKRAVGG